MRCVGGKKRKYDSSLASMLDRTRVVLCAVMFAVMLFNPFGSLLPAAVPGVANIRAAGRTLLSDDSTTGKLSNSRCCSYLCMLEQYPFACGWLGHVLVGCFCRGWFSRLVLAQPVILDVQCSSGCRVPGSAVYL